MECGRILSSLLYGLHKYSSFTIYTTRSFPVIFVVFLQYRLECEVIFVQCDQVNEYLGNSSKLLQRVLLFIFYFLHMTKSMCIAVQLSFFKIPFFNIFSFFLIFYKKYKGSCASGPRFRMDDFKMCSPKLNSGQSRNEGWHRYAPSPKPPQVSTTTPNNLQL